MKRHDDGGAGRGQRRGPPALSRPHVTGLLLQLALAPVACSPGPPAAGAAPRAGTSASRPAPESGPAEEARSEQQRRRAATIARVELVMGPLPTPEGRCPLAVEVLSEEDAGSHTRTRIRYCPEPEDHVPAYLLRPKGLEGRAPAMLCLHQTTAIGKGEPAGLGGKESLHYALELVERGYVCLVPDYPSFGDYPFDFTAWRDRYASGSMKAIWNNVRAVDLLVSLTEVDPDRIGCIGHSLGGHNAIFTAVFEERLRAVVTSCGFTSFRRYYGGDLRGWTSDRYMPRIRDVYGNDPRRVPFDFADLVAAIAPRAFFTSSPVHDDNFDVVGVREAMEEAARAYEALGAGDALAALYPDSAHDFPRESREAAYAWLDARLR